MGLVFSKIRSPTRRPGQWASPAASFDDDDQQIIWYYLAVKDL